MSDSAAPLPRPETGFGAWQSTLGYISKHHSSDARLILYVYPQQDQVMWSARVSWGTVIEEYNNAPGLPAALARLWRQVDRYHRVFETPEDAYRGPVGYVKTQWVDLPTQDVLHRMLWTVRLALLEDWMIMICYQAIEDPATRVTMRLIGQKNRVLVGGRGPSLLDAARDLFRNSASVFARQSAGDDLPETR